MRLRVDAAMVSPSKIVFLSIASLAELEEDSQRQITLNYFFDHLMITVYIRRRQTIMCGKERPSRKINANLNGMFRQEIEDALLKNSIVVEKFEQFIFRVLVIRDLQLSNYCANFSENVFSEFFLYRDKQSFRCLDTLIFGFREGHC